MPPVPNSGSDGPMRNTLASLPRSGLPWSDVIIDCQGPFKKSAEGMCYIASYHCTLLGVCRIRPFRRLTKNCFLQAMAACVMRARRIPDIVRTDRGPEMTSAVMEEFLTLCTAHQFLGAAFTARHQGPGERKHISVMQQWLILIHKVCKAFPQEWDVLAPVVEYLMDSDIGECRFSAHEMQTGYSLHTWPHPVLPDRAGTSPDAWHPDRCLPDQGKGADPTQPMHSLLLSSQSSFRALGPRRVTLRLLSGGLLGLSPPWACT